MHCQLRELKLAKHGERAMIKELKLGKLGVQEIHGGTVSLL
jgi:hypothetical protein